MIIEYNFDNERPIYVQLVKKLKVGIISGKLKSGEKLPSVRDFANMAGVNPNTMQKALAELESTELIRTERTSGKFVTDDAGLIEKVRIGFASDLVANFIHDMNKIGIDQKTAVKILKRRV